MASDQERNSTHRVGIKPKFESAAFTATVRDLRFTPSGDVILSLVVPYSEKHLAVPVSDAYGMQIEVQMSRKMRTKSVDK
jgi:hypothetical protein